jgi:hypothetical protein
MEATLSSKTHLRLKPVSSVKGGLGIIAGDFVILNAVKDLLQGPRFFASLRMTKLLPATLIPSCREE